MKNNNLVAGVDVGSSSIKWTIYDYNTHKIMHYGNLRYPSGTFNRDNIDIITIGKFFKKIISMLYEYGVSNVGMSTMAPILIALNEENIPMTGIPYNSLLGSEFLKDLPVEYVHNSTMNVPNVQFFYQKIKWLEKHRPNILLKTKHIVDLNGFLFSSLGKNGKQMVEDVNTALEWGFLNYSTKYWDNELLNISNIADKLPDLVNPEFFKCYRGMNVSIGTVDTIASALGSIGMDSSKIFITNGSTLCAGYVSNEPLNTRKLYNDLFFQGKYLVNGCNSQYSTILDWAETSFKRHINVNRINTNPLNIIFLPYLEGERCPIFNTEIRAGFYGMDKSTTRNDLIASVVHSLAYISIDMIEHLQSVGDANQQYASIIAGGGLSKKNLASIISSMTGLRYEITGVDPATLGASLIAMKGNDIIKNYPKNTRDFGLIIEKTIEPDTNFLSHEKTYNNFKKIRDMILKNIASEKKL